MSEVKPLPDGISAIMPMLVCNNPSIEVEFCKNVFGAIEIVSRPGPDGTVAHAALKIAGAMIMIEAEWPGIASRSPQPDGSSSVIIYLYVENVDEVIERTIKAGGKILQPAKNQFWGDRTGRIMDPSNHVWIISSRIEETTTSQRQDRWDEMLSAATANKLQSGTST